MKRAGRKTVRGAKAPRAPKVIDPSGHPFVHREDFNGLCRVVEDIRKAVEPKHSPYQVPEAYPMEYAASTLGSATMSRTSGEGRLPIRPSLEGIYNTLLRTLNKASTFEENIFPSNSPSTRAEDPPPPVHLQELLNAIGLLLDSVERKIDAIRDRF